MAEKYLCSNCYEAISNPVCIHCFIKHIRHWMNDAGLNKAIKNTLIKDIMRIDFEDCPSGVSCIVCEKEDVTICSYCFFYKVLDILKKNGLNAQKIENFLEIFNYQLGHEDYIV